jgi:ribosome-associated protein
MIEVTDLISLRDDEAKLEFVQSSGPGGQNVNKVASKAQLRFDTNSSSLPEDVRSRLRQIAKKRISDDGILLIEARRYRTQDQNRADAISRLVVLIRKAAEKPKTRRRTRPTEASIQKRLESKRRRSETKQKRRRIDLD